MAGIARRAKRAAGESRWQFRPSNLAIPQAIDIIRAHRTRGINYEKRHIFLLTARYWFPTLRSSTAPARIGGKENGKRRPGRIGRRDDGDGNRGDTGSCEARAQPGHPRLRTRCGRRARRALRSEDGEIERRSCAAPQAMRIAAGGKRAMTATSMLRRGFYAPLEESRFYRPPLVRGRRAGRFASASDFAANVRVRRNDAPPCRRRCVWRGSAPASEANGGGAACYFPRLRCEDGTNGRSIAILPGAAAATAVRDGAAVIVFATGADVMVRSGFAALAFSSRMNCA